MAAKKSKTVKKAVTAKKKPAVAKRAVTAKKSATAKKKPAAVKKAATSKKKPAAAKKAAPIKKKPAAAKRKPVAQTEMERLLEAANRLEETVLDMDPDNSELDLTLEDLEQVLREVLRLDPSNVATMIRLGEFFLDRNGAEDLALEYFEQAFALQPGDKKLAKLIKKAKAQLAENED